MSTKVHSTCIYCTTTDLSKSSCVNLLLSPESLFPGHPQISSCSDPQLQDKIWEWPGNEAMFQTDQSTAVQIK